MDFIAHYLWTYILFHNSSSLKLALILSVLPDLLSWGIWSFYILFYTRKNVTSKNIKLLPEWTFTLYGLTHSVFIFSFVFLIVMLITRTFPVYMVAWFLHIVMDIPLHSRKLFPTPFLWPISDWKFPGINWGNKYLIIANYAIIASILWLLL